MEKSLNEIYETLITDEELTDDILKTFRDIDIMMSLGMMAWMFKTCKEVDEKLKSGKYITNCCAIHPTPKGVGWIAQYKSLCM